MELKAEQYFYDPNNKALGELACWCWHKEINDPEATMTLRHFLPDGEVQIFASFGYWSWTNGIDPTEVSYEEFIQNVRCYFPDMDENRIQ